MKPGAIFATYPSLSGGSEFALSIDRARAGRLLIIPALFDESNKLRRFAAEIMRRLDHAGIDSFLPDLPGQNESLAPLNQQSLVDWRDEAAAAARHFHATHIFTIRGGALLAPDALPGWRYAPVSGTSLLRGMLRARVLSSKEAGKQERREDLLELGRTEGLELAGYQLGPSMISGLETAEPAPSEGQAEIAQGDVGGAGLWMRAEPDHNQEQAERLASLIAEGMTA